MVWVNSGQWWRGGRERAGRAGLVWLEGEAWQGRGSTDTPAHKPHPTPPPSFQPPLHPLSQQPQPSFLAFTFPSLPFPGVGWGVEVEERRRGDGVLRVGGLAVGSQQLLAALLCLLLFSSSQLYLYSCVTPFVVVSVICILCACPSHVSLSPPSLVPFSSRSVSSMGR